MVACALIEGADRLSRPHGVSTVCADLDGVRQRVVEMAGLPELAAAGLQEEVALLSTAVRPLGEHSDLALRIMNLLNVPHVFLHLRTSLK